MKTLYRKKAVALYDERIRIGFVVMTAVFYILAAILWYALAAILPYTPTVKVSDNENVTITKTALSATSEQISKPEGEKERALLMPSGESSYARRLRLVEDAESSIDFMVYDTYEESYSYYFYTALVRAADRGVHVRIMVDGKMGRLNGALSDIGDIVACNENIELYHFNPVDILEPKGLMTLMHDKVMIVDSDKLIVGGVNMGTSAFLRNCDMEVMITNSGEFGASGQAERYFENMLKSGLAEREKSKKFDSAKKAEYEKQYIEFYEQSEFAGDEVDYNAQGVAVDRATFVTNRISKDKKSPIIWQAVCNLMRNAEKSTVVTPYALLQDDKKQEIREIAQSNDQFRLITNSLYNTRNVAYADYYYNREDYINKHITLLEYQAADQLHAKMFSVDDRYSVIGSFNLDERSAHIDTESVVIIDSAEFNKVLNEYIEEQFVNNSLQVGLDNEYIPSETVQSHTVSTQKKIKYALYSALGIVRCLI